MADASNETWNWIFGCMSSILGGLFVYNNKRINDMPEKYVMKKELHQVKTELREDIKNNKDEILEAITRLHERIDRRRNTDGK